jgi:fatty acid desaturase
MFRLGYNSEMAESEIKLDSITETTPVSPPAKLSKRRKSLIDRYPIPNALNAAVVSLQLVAATLCFATLSSVDSIPGLFCLAVVFGVIMNSVYSTIHEAHHRILFSKRRLNDFFGIFLSLLFPAPFHLLRQGHLGHHRRNRSDDEAFDLYFSRDNAIWKYFAWYGILTGLYWILVVASNLIILFAPKLMDPKLYNWDKTSEVFLGHFSEESFRAMRIEAAAAIAVQYGIFYLTGATLQSYAAMYFGFGLMWSSLQYVHHYQAERDVINGARNHHIWAPLDTLWLNHNWHQTHHQLPTVPWYYLKELAMEAGTKSTSLIPAYFSMWRGPQYAEPGVRNHFDGEVSN